MRFLQYLGIGFLLGTIIYFCLPSDTDTTSEVTDTFEHGTTYQGPVKGTTYKLMESTFDEEPTIFYCMEYSGEGDTYYDQRGKEYDFSACPEDRSVLMNPLCSYWFQKSNEGCD